MSGYALTALAKADIFAIWSYIANDNEDAANRVEQGIYGACGAAQAPTGQAGDAGSFARPAKLEPVPALQPTLHDTLEQHGAWC